MFQRVSSESAYLTPEVLTRKNITVATNTTVTRIIFEEIADEIHATGVEFAKDKNGKRYWAKSRRDIVLRLVSHKLELEYLLYYFAKRWVCPFASCKCIQFLPNNVSSVCPLQILMLSGVGPAEHLRSHKIPVVFEHPQIGKNLVDHPVVDLYFKDKHNSSVKWMKPRSFNDLIKLMTAMVQYFVLGSGGPLATNVSASHPLDGLPSNPRKKFGESAAFIRSDDPKLFPSSEYPQHLTDSTSAADSPDLELFTTPFAYKV